MSTRHFERLGPQLARSNLPAAVLVLALAGAVLALLQYFGLRRDLIDNADAQARIVALNSAAAVMFDDRVVAQEMLDALSASATVHSARLENATGQVLATYTTVAPDADADAQACELQCARVAAPIEYAGQHLGTVVLHVSLQRVYSRLFAFAGAFLLAALVALALSLPLLARMRARMRSAEARLEYLAHHDAVTGQRNRNAFNATLQRVHSSRTREPHALLQLDMDRFKEINDTLGHFGGDELLRQVGVRLRSAIRDSDTLFRLGGDEFAVLMRPVVSAAVAETVAQRILVQFTAPFSVAGQELHVTASIGVSLYPLDSPVFLDLPGNADAAMYEAKRHGRNRVAFFDPQLREAMAERLRLQTDLRRALEHDELSLHYQAQVDTCTGALTGIEALLRWEHPTLGAISPATFVPVAEESGLIVPIGRWVIGEACRQFAAWRQEGFDGVCIAVNLSVRQTRDEQLPAFIDAVLDTHAMPPGCLELEITESVLMEQTDLAIALLTRLRARGLRLAIDDFGTGYSSMAYLQRLPIDTLKIDMAFVREIPGDGEAITTAILAMAHQLGLGVVAEGVETQAQHDFLREAGCEQIQGYRIARPLPPEAFLLRWGARAQA
ncbi:putative bifunctional diguanylate cyclase/phosphodiesterase [Luteimonas terrae]|uniref:Diguanylate cyclase (GGDEF)-like protein n=1 Tax=Luteimonas terrae TaxID=1530191 RepID=A0ABU1XTL9_9GAMM|nr:EAL domain-containing protein [Luteimonas terrae]MDR7191908.1 diguanylate cyclase (GGDEF)-like protein [Luteimonas terrae]